MLNEGNQIHNFMSSSGSGSVINYGSGSVINYGSGSGSDFLTSYSSGSGSGSKSQKVTVPTVPVPVPQHCPILSNILNECIITGCAGAGAAGVPQLWAAVGRGDTHGAAPPAQDQVCGRAQALRARSLRPARCLQVSISLGKLFFFVPTNRFRVPYVEWSHGPTIYKDIKS